jgi:hypothetical protein
MVLFKYDRDENSQADTYYTFNVQPIECILQTERLKVGMDLFFERKDCYRRTWKDHVND